MENIDVSSDNDDDHNVITFANKSTNSEHNTPLENKRKSGLKTFAYLENKESSES